MIVRTQALHKISVRLATLATLLACWACGCGLFATSAQAAEAGVNLNGLARSNVAEASALGAHWVRVFVTWPDLEPARGVHSAFWLGQYDRLLGSLPKGTHAILDFVDTPSWESGSAAPNAPPSNPADYAESSTSSPALGRESGGV